MTVDFLLKSKKVDLEAASGLESGGIRRFYHDPEFNQLSNAVKCC